MHTHFIRPEDLLEVKRKQQRVDWTANRGHSQQQQPYNLEKGLPSTDWHKQLYWSARGKWKQREKESIVPEREMEMENNHLKF